MTIQTNIMPSLLVFVFAILAATGCATVKKTTAINLLVPSDGYTKQQFSYGRHRLQSLDVYLPKTNTPKIPVVYVYGSAWKNSFNKSDFVFVAQALTSLGHPVIIPEYRRYPEAQFPLFINDVADAISYIERQNIGLLKPFNEYILMGHSSGAHTVALLATDLRYLNERRVTARLRGLIGMSGPYDLPMDDAEVLPIFNTTTAQRAKPTLNIRRGMPPTLLLHGAIDPRVPSYHTTRFRDALQRKGNAVTTRLYPGVDHEKLLGGIAAPLRFMSDSFKDVRDFLKRYD